MKIILSLTFLFAVLSFSSDRQGEVETLYFLANKELNQKEITDLKNSANLKSINIFYDRKGDFWQRYYQVEAKNKQSFRLLKHSQLITYVEKPAKAEIFSLEPNQEKVFENQDLFFNYQWSLNNFEQKIFRDTDDIHPIIIESNTDYDIGWLDFYQSIKSKKQKKVRVAVIDSGLSYTHKEIKDQLYKNEVECRFGKINIGTTEDNDNNGFAGDCIGWNFSSRSKLKQNDVSDDIGHGTHVAGIIAAKAENLIGISGVNDQIEILPLKVYNKSRSQEESRNNAISIFVQNVAKAILYSIDRKVDVINLSLGWPLISHSEVIDKAIDEALSAGISIVAGAGNDSHNAKVLPCSLEGVICVGATDIEGKYAVFSNYGSYVDILAPGEEILSLWPPLLKTRFFGARKYEILSGTSQSTPIISALVASLKSAYPSIDEEEIKARLSLSAKKISDKEKYSQSGIVNLNQALILKPDVYLEPKFKSISFNNLEQQVLQIDLPVKNYWKEAKDVEINISSKDLSFVKSQFFLGDFKKGEEKLLNILGQAKEKTNSRIAIEVNIKAKGFNQKFKHKHVYLNSLDKAKGYTKKVDSDLPLRTVHAFNETETFDYYTAKKEEDGLSIRLYKLNEKTQETYDYKIKGATSLFPSTGIMRLDIDDNGRSNYIVTSRHGEGENTSLQQSYLDENFKEVPFLPQNLVFNDEGITYENRTIQILPYEFDGKIINLPHFVSAGPIPKIDKNPDPFEASLFTNKGLYTKAPHCREGKCWLQTRLINNYKFDQDIKNRLNIRFDEDAFFLSAEGSQDSISFFISYGLAAQVSFARVELSVVTNKIKALTKVDLPQLDIRFHKKQKISDSLTAYFGLYTNTGGRIVLIDSNQNKHEVYPIKLKNKSNAIVSLLNIFIKNERLHTFIETEQDLIHYSWAINMPEEHSYSSSPIFRFSYLPGHFFTDSLHSIKGRDSHFILNDSSQIHERGLFTWEVDEGKIQSRQKNSFTLPRNCILLNPQKAENFEYLVVQCKEEKGFALRFLRLD